jgi:hypothetical protein
MALNMVEMAKSSLGGGCAGAARTACVPRSASRARAGPYLDCTSARWWALLHSSTRGVYSSNSMHWLKRQVDTGVEQGCNASRPSPQLRLADRHAQEP